MQIVRGKGKLVGVTSEADERNYVPSRPKPSFKTVLMLGSLRFQAREYKPVKPGGKVGKIDAETSQGRSEKDSDENFSSLLFSSLLFSTLPPPLQM